MNLPRLVSRIQALALLAGLGISPLSAASVPWVGVLNTSSSISVPAGKILVIEHMCINSASANGTTITVPLSIAGTSAGGIGSGPYSAVVQYTVGGMGVVAIPGTLRLGPGTTLTLAPGIALNISVLGVAMDAGDFFASADPVLQGASDGQGRLSAIVDTRTVAPTKTTADVSADLQTWTTAGVVVSPSATNPRVSRISVPQNGASKLFLRAKVVRRPMPVLSR